MPSGPGVLPTAATAPPPAGTVLLDLGPEHPSGTGLVELRLWVTDGVVTDATVVVGALHRGVEKLFEVRDYRQVLVLADRHDWQAPFAAELTVALTCERLLGLEVPPRAVWLRTLLAEHTRLLSHLGFLAWVPFRLGVPSPTARAPRGAPAPAAAPDRQPRPPHGQPGRRARRRRRRRLAGRRARRC